MCRRIGSTRCWRGSSCQASAINSTICSTRRRGRNLSTVRDAGDAVRARDRPRKDHRRIDMALKAGALPGDEASWRASTSRLSHPSTPSRSGTLPHRGWIANGENVLLLGPPGVGKTHLGIALAVKRSLPATQCSSPPPWRWSPALPRRMARNASMRSCSDTPRRSC